MLGFLLVVVPMLVLLRFRLEMVARLEGGSRELVGIGQLFSCIWSSVSIMGLVVVSVLEVDRMGVVGREVVMVNFVSNGGQVELFSEAEVEEDLAGTWHHQGKQGVVGTG